MKSLSIFYKKLSPSEITSMILTSAWVNGGWCHGTGGTWLNSGWNNA